MRNLTEAERLRRLDRSIARQRLYLGLARLWRALHWPLMTLGITLAVLASGILLRLPQLAQVAILAAAGLAILAALRSVIGLRWPRAEEATRHMERAAGFNHRPLSSMPDRVAAEIIDPAADAMWDEHRRRQLAKLEKVPVEPPRSDWRRLDPRALRVPVALAALVAIVLGPNDLLSNLRQSATLQPAVADVPLALDAWLKPPAYTGRAPLLLSSPQLAERLAAGGAIEIPENAAFTLRLAGADDPAVSFRTVAGDTALDDVVPKTVLQQNTLTSEAMVSRPMTIVVTDGARELARWPIVTIPDRPPGLSLTEPPSSDSQGSLTLKWKADDDYGVKKLSAEIALADQQDDGQGFESNGVFLFDPPALKIQLRGGSAKEQTGTSRFDLASHPWAGLQVMLEMTAEDAAGHATAIAPVNFKLPERSFVKPLPRALIEQRKQIILFPERAAHTGQMLDTLALYPKGLFEGAAPVLAMAAIASRLRNAAGYDDVNMAIDMLWELAVALEEGSLRDAKAELQALKEELAKALRDGAPQERIAELMKKLREAMDRYLDAMREEAERLMREGQLQPMQPGEQGQPMNREELQKMLDAMEELSKGGANDMAQQLLDELDRILQNLQMGQGTQQGEGQGEMDEMMQGLGDLMRRQQRLMDETQRLPGEGTDPGTQGEQGEQGQQPGQGRQGRGGNQGSGDDLAERQRELRRMLEDLQSRGQGRMSGDVGDAGRAMEGAEESLRQGDREGALQKQGEALDKLRQGAQDLAQQMRDQGQGQSGNQSQDGQGLNGEDDPLGRPRATRGQDQGPREDIVPSERAMQRAREILEGLRAKSNDRGLSDSERSYIERLLRGMY